MNLKHPNQTMNPAVKQQSITPQQPQQPDLNFLLALSLVSVKKPELFLKQPTLVDVNIFK